MLYRENIKRTDENKITVKGYDLNGMLLDRITMARDTGIEGRTFLRDRGLTFVLR